MQEEWARALTRDGGAEPEEGSNLTPRERELEDLVNLADGLLSTTEKACLEYLPRTPAELTEATEALRHQLERRNPAELRAAIEHLERITRDLFEGPDGPRGPTAAGASLGKIDGSDR